MVSQEEPHPSQSSASTPGPASGCFAALQIAVIVGGLLFLNGALLMSVMRSLEEQGFPFADDARVQQFVVFLVPLLLVILQMTLFDTIRMMIGRRGSRAMDHETDSIGDSEL
ncbi:MAG: hypothetical protein AAFP90_12990 [Planctomycetota bacterium]